MAVVISALVGLLQSIGRSSSAMEMSSVFAGAGLLRSSSKCTAHLLSCLSSPIKTLLFLSLIGHSVCANLFVSFFVMIVVELFHVPACCCLLPGSFYLQCCSCLF